MRLEELGELVEELATLVAGGVVPPDGVEGLLRSLDGGVDILGGALGDASDELAGGGVDNAAKVRSVVDVRDKERDPKTGRLGLWFSDRQVPPGRLDIERP